MQSQVLVICGPTATGKTGFGLDIAKKFAGEIVSADSRQVYVGKNLIYGKDLPQNLKPRTSNLTWKDKFLKYYEIEGIKIWLYDVVKLDEEFSVAWWRECAQTVIEDIRQRGGLPIVVGGTGLYIKALTHNLTQITIPRNLKLRKELVNKNADYLWNYLRQIQPMIEMNESDRRNPRRLIRAIEIASQDARNKTSNTKVKYDFLQIGLTADKGELFKRVNRRVNERITAGAAGEDPILSAQPQLWKQMEHQIVRQQLTWFKKQPDINWFDITQPGWSEQAQNLIGKWYNQPDA